jgi:hypothetical protein
MFYRAWLQRPPPSSKRAQPTLPLHCMRQIQSVVAGVIISHCMIAALCVGGPLPCMFDQRRALASVYECASVRACACKPLPPARGAACAPDRRTTSRPAPNKQVAARLPAFGRRRLPQSVLSIDIPIFFFRLWPAVYVNDGRPSSLLTSARHLPSTTFSRPVWPRSGCLAALCLVNCNHCRCTTAAIRTRHTQHAQHPCITATG